MVSSDLLTTREAAELLGVGTTSVKRWADSGLLRCVKTPGGHRRFPRDAVGEFMRTHEDGVPDDADDRLARWVRLLTTGSGATDVTAELLAERDQLDTWWQLADSLGPVISEIGRQWETGAISVLHEHLASERLSRGLARCAETIAVPDGAPACLLAVVPGDDHSLGLSLCEVCLREAGWVARWAGRRTPTELVRDFVAAGEVQMVALSASVYSTDEPAMEHLIATLGEACRAHGAVLVLGGTGLWPAIPSYGHRLHNFAQLATLLEKLRAA